jgi:protocatechuate 3,4-dioxygenase beta subunit
MMLASAHADAVPTPRQNEGPFYPTGFPADMANDLVQVRGQQARAMGQVPHLEGRAIGIDGGGGRPGALATTMDIVIA